MRILAVVVSALALAVAGCGGESKQESYRKEFQPVNRSLVQLGRDVGRELQAAPGRSDAQLGREFGSFADRLGTIQGKLRGLEPPDKLKRDQNTLLRAVGRARSALHGIELAA